MTRRIESGSWPRLLADVGGTNARFALETARFVFEEIEVLRCANYPSLRAAAQAYLGAVSARVPGLPAVRHAAIAIATAVDGDVVAMTNHHWCFSIEAFRRELNLLTLAVVNDFTALAMSLPHLAPHQRVQVGGGAPRPGAPIGLVGPGTGLGVSGLVHARDGWTALASEGGHVSFAPNSDLEIDLLRAMRHEWPHASAERLLSGAGLEFIHRVVSGGATRSAPDITGRALEEGCDDCLLTVDTFCAMLGSVAGNVALTLGATGGVYIGGGIVPRIAALLERSAFRARFEAKGRLSAYLARIPTYWIAEPYPAFFGVSAVLSHPTTERPGH
jgi:glucokinase